MKCAHDRRKSGSQMHHHLSENVFCCREHRDAFNKARDNNVEKVARFDRANGV